MKVRALRGFNLASVARWPGSVVEVPNGLGRELIALGKAEQVDDGVELVDAPEPAPPIAQPGAGEVRARPTKTRPATKPELPLGEGA